MANSYCIYKNAFFDSTPHGRNEATQIKTGKYGEAYASPGVLNNKSNQTQTSVALTNVTSKNMSNNYQFGNDNLANSTQTRYRNTENVLQEGSGNASYGTQTAASFLFYRKCKYCALTR